MPIQSISQTWKFFHVTENYQDKFLIFDEYKINENSNQILSAKYGEWNPADGLSMYEENIWKRRANLKGYQFRYAALYTLRNRQIQKRLTYSNWEIIIILLSEYPPMFGHNLKLLLKMIVHLQNVSKDNIQTFSTLFNQ